MTRSNDPTEGACASCRKSIPLVPDSQGDLVLRTHHVVTEERGYDVQECAGSRTAAADLDDAKDWAWVPEPTAEEPVEPVPLSEALARAAAPMRAFSEAFQIGQATIAVNGSVTRAQNHVRPPEDLLLDISAAVRQAYVDATGGPPEGAVVVEQNVGLYGAHVLSVQLIHRGEPLRIAVRFNPCLRWNSPALRERLAQEAAHRLRQALRRGDVCADWQGPHECFLRGPHPVHRCGVPTCRVQWPNGPEVVADGTS